LFFWGQPQTPWLRFAESWGPHTLLRSRTNAFASFLEKKKGTIIDCFSGASPRPRGSASRRVGEPISFCEAELTLLLLFWKRREPIMDWFKGFLGPAPDPVTPLRGEFMFSCEAELMLLLLFWKRRESIMDCFKGFLGQPLAPGSASRRFVTTC
jgi:hypothetical protein